MSIVETIRKQAAAVKDEQARLAMATAFEALAKDLRGDTTEKISFKKMFGSDKKPSRVQRIAAAMGAEKERKIEEQIKAAGWVAIGPANGPKAYGMPGKQGIQLRRLGGSFSVHHGAHTVQPKITPINVNEFLEEVKGKI